MIVNDTIAALATPPGEGALAVIRISGSKALAVADKIFRGAKPPSLMEERRVGFGRIVSAEGEVIDEVLLTVFSHPRSYTGEDLVEISGHGGSLVASRVLAATLAAGARMARPGEFTERAFLNGKLDLTQAEAVMDLISAQTPRAARAATGSPGVVILNFNGVAPSSQNVENGSYTLWAFAHIGVSPNYADATATTIAHTIASTIQGYSDSQLGTGNAKLTNLKVTRTADGGIISQTY